MEDEKVVISSLVVEARPESVDAVARALAALEGVEVHEVNGYKTVVPIEASSTGASPVSASVSLAGAQPTSAPVAVSAAAPLMKFLREKLMPVVDSVMF